ncbi:ATP-binding cassette domain-containing protein [Devosia ginsengisoli]|uniref:ATP-binding cassette domain-containing protein n=1 Tax=Devosia ginsengisoli TaxID=400770 RepID=UPI0026F3231A|nr:ATP-binding cassette domain-containing protein [Devosia ginsengisoli]
MKAGSGKSVSARSVLQIVDRPGRIVGGEMMLTRPDGTSVDIAKLDPRGKAIPAIRGRGDRHDLPGADVLAFAHPQGRRPDRGNPLRIHFGMKKAERRERVIELLRQVEIPNPEKAIDRYTFEFSGGMRQRVMIAMALACNPRC